VLRGIKPLEVVNGGKNFFVLGKPKRFEL
jgi:hypothetical protein